MKFAYYDDEALRRQISGTRFAVTYLFRMGEKEALSAVRNLLVEQTVEFPAEHIECDAIQSDILGCLEDFGEAEDGFRALVSYPAEDAGADLPQLLNVVFGNSSILPDITVERVTLPEAMLGEYSGPRYGVEGLRRKLGARRRPFSFTALKPLGLPTAALAEEAYRCALGGIDLIKDDHGLMDQPFSRYLERVRAVSAAVRRANEETGGHTIYVPNASGAYAEMQARMDAAVEAGAEGIMFAPGLVGFDMLRAASQRTELVVVSHPAFLGSFIDRGRGGIDCACLLGQLTRLAGADITVFPNYGGRFSLTEAQCRGIRDRAQEPCGMAATIPAPAGGMKVGRVCEICGFYGNDTALLIGGSLFTSPGGLTENCRRFRDTLMELE